VYVPQIEAAKRGGIYRSGVKVTPEDIFVGTRLYEILADLKTRYERLEASPAANSALVVKAQEQYEHRNYLDAYRLLKAAGQVWQLTAVASGPTQVPAPLMDEPFTGLDYARRAALHQVLLELWRNAGNTVLFVTHNIEESLPMANRIVVMVRGRIVEDFRLTSPPRREPEALRADEVNEMRLAVIEHLKAAMSDTDSDIGGPSQPRVRRPSGRKPFIRQ
jgi:energy-coupling factor transporter ATP-binding protein EcfA2